ncbi:hypothetical protein CYY_003843 [Polysphondylium violaceum]|uniref:EGF-like domain-containing protein n=1 Tax=Polysphondylium violaceum TaxID=133409 RepID=A0A8J4PX43_9MYCE|nr:hypothetical protein CYY_003843 [Polysphondylium violaceum]
MFEKNFIFFIILIFINYVNSNWIGLNNLIIGSGLIEFNHESNTLYSIDQNLIYIYNSTNLLNQWATPLFKNQILKSSLKTISFIKVSYDGETFYLIDSQNNQLQVLSKKLKNDDLLSQTLKPKIVNLKQTANINSMALNQNSNNQLVLSNSSMVFILDQSFNVKYSIDVVKNISSIDVIDNVLYVVGGGDISLFNIQDGTFISKLQLNSLPDDDRIDASTIVPYMCVADSMDDSSTLYVLDNVNKRVIGIEKSDDSNDSNYYIERVLDLALNDTYADLVATKDGVFISSALKGTLFYQWIGSMISRVSYVAGKIEIHGQELSNITKIYLQGDKDNLCTDIYVVSDELVVCFYPYINQLLTGKTYKVIAEIGQETISSEFNYVSDGCQPGFWYDSNNNQCKVLKIDSLYVHKCFNVKDGLSISRISTTKDQSICPKGWAQGPISLMDISHNRIIRYQTCWNMRNLTTFTEIDAVATTDTPSLCPYSLEAPIYVDLSTTLKLWQATCFNMFGTQEKIQSYFPPGLYECDTKGIEIKKIDLWDLGSRCLHGIPDGKSGECSCFELWKGAQCDEPLCSDGSIFNLDINQCQCNKTCAENEILLEYSCQCICSFKSPIKCSHDARCVSLITDCLTNENKSNDNTDSLLAPFENCNATHPYKCFDKQCKRTPAECKQLSNQCLFKSCCWDGTINTGECSILPKCHLALPFRCPDGSCQLANTQCLANFIINPECGTNQSISLCPDGSSCPPCAEFNGCPLDLPYQCSSGECGKSSIDCVGSQLHLLKDQLLPIYVKPISTQLTIPFGESSHLHLYDTKGSYIANLGFFIPSPDSFINSSTSHETPLSLTQITVKPVADSYLRTIKFHDENVTRELGIFSPVLNITMAGVESDQVFPFVVNITFKVKAEISGLSLRRRLPDLCLGFINTTSNEWQCVHHKGNQKHPSILRLNQLTMISDTEVMGFTNHFTSFGILLRSEDDPLNSANRGAYLNGDQGKKHALPNKVVLSTVFAVIGMVLLIFLFSTLYISYRNHGSLKQMKKVYSERLKYTFTKKSDKKQNLDIEHQAPKHISIDNDNQ